MVFGRSKSKNLPATVEGANGLSDDPGTAAKVLSHIIESSTRVQAPAVRAYVERLRSQQPDATPAQIVSRLEKHYLAAVMASGAAVGSAAAFPGIGTLAALSAVAGETVVFLEATSVFVLAVAEVHGIPADHRERRRALVLSVLVGEDSKTRAGRPARDRAHERRMAVRRRSNAAPARGVAAELPAGQVLREAVYAQARRHGLRQAAAGGHRRAHRRSRQPHDG